MATVEHINDTHIQYDGHVFNESLLVENNYTIYSNGTLSNSSSHCYLIFGIYDVDFFPNGTAQNGTKCETPIRQIRMRSGLGLGFGCIFAVMIVLGLTCLNKHGRSFLPLEKHFRLVSRRWPWYWYLVAATCGCISGFVGFDIDRVILQGTSLILQNVFYYCTLPAILGAIWEMTRHWGSWCERQLVDEDPWRFVHSDFRGKIEFYLPLVFYLFGFMASWAPYFNYAIDDATDPRFKASSIFALLAWMVIFTSICVSLKYYQPVSRRVPAKIPLCMAVVLVRIGYNIAVAWEFSIGPLKFDAHNAYIFCLGYTPVVIVMIVMCIWGGLEMNDDLKLKEQRKEREKRMDQELGILPEQQLARKLEHTPGDDQARRQMQLRDSQAESTASSPPPPPPPYEDTPKLQHRSSDERTLVAPTSMLNV